MHRSNVSISHSNNNGNSSEKEDLDLSDTGDQFQFENVLFEMKAINKSYLQSNVFRYNPARIVRKSGRLNLFLKQLQNKRIQYMRDLGNTLLTIRWRWILLTLCLVNFASFFLFAFMWMLVAEVSGDFDDANNGIQEKCIVNVNGFNGFLLLSIETITTIGFGYYYPTEKCSHAWLVLTLESMVNIGLQGVLISAVYVKIAKPYTKMSNSLFSKRAVICLRDGTLRLIFRLNDPSGKIWCNTSISVYFIDKSACLNNNASASDFVLKRMKVQPHGLLIFPLEIEHIIDEHSPLWEVEAGDMLQTRFEIVVVAEGNSIVTGQLSQNRTSYTNDDIKWGQKFVSCIDEYDSHYVMNYMNFKQTVPCYAPLCSAKKLREIEAASN